MFAFLVLCFGLFTVQSPTLAEMKILWCLVLVVTLKEGLSQNRLDNKVDVKTLTKRSSPPDEDTSHIIRTKDVSEEDIPATEEMKLTFLKNASVTCNDGSPAGYYLRENRLRKRWLIYLEAGRFCYDKRSCDKRNIKYPNRMTSTLWPLTKKGTGILSVEEKENPYWSTANIVYVPYCSSDLWIGTKIQPGPGDYAFMGSLIIQQVIKDLRGHGIRQANVVMLAGSGLGVLMNIDRVAPILKDVGAVAAQVRGLVDSGWFLDLEPFRPRDCNDYVLCSPLTVIKQGLSFWNAALPESCKSQFSEPDQWQCSLGHKLYPSIKAPVFVVQYLFDYIQLVAQNVISVQTGYSHLTEEEMTYMQSVALELKKSLVQVQGAFAPSCMAFQLITNSNWQDLKIEGYSLANALRCWEKSLGDNPEVKGCPFHLIEDCRWPQCSPACPTLYDPVTTLEFDLWKYLGQRGFDIHRKTWN